MKKQTICKKMLSCIAVLSMIIGMGMLTGCNSKQTADLVVYGKIYDQGDSSLIFY